MFLASLERAPIRKATAEQRRLWLLAAEGITVRTDASIHLLGNRYWTEALLDLRGAKVAARFDPEALHEGLHVYRLDGSYVAHAPCVEAAGFADQAAARAHAQARRSWLKAQAEALRAERKLSIEDVAAMQMAVMATPAPEPRVVRPVFGNLALKPSAEPAIAADETLVAFQKGVVRLFQQPEGAG